MLSSLIQTYPNPDPNISALYTISVILQEIKVQVLGGMGQQIVPMGFCLFFTTKLR
jgi:hypothetical protein